MPSTASSNSTSSPQHGRNNLDVDPTVPASSSPGNTGSCSSGSSVTRSGTTSRASIEINQHQITDSSPNSSPLLSHVDKNWTEACLDLVTYSPGQSLCCKTDPAHRLDNSKVISIGSTEDVFSLRLRGRLLAVAKERLIELPTTKDNIRRSQSLPACTSMAPPDCISRVASPLTQISDFKEDSHRRKRTLCSIVDVIEPQPKRLKLTHSSEKFHAYKPASLRRAESLKAPSGSDFAYAPTAPASPLLPVEENDGNERALRRRIRCQDEDPMGPVPIIAPPADYIASLPLSPASESKVRLRRLMEREDHSRTSDGLGSSYSQQDNALSSTRSWERRLGIGKLTRKEILLWILEVLPVYMRKEHTSALASQSSTPNSESASVSAASPCTFTRSQSSSSSSSNATNPPRNIPDLVDQLSSSPETRFHAVYMFLRYCFVIIGQNDCDTANIPGSKSTKKYKGMDREVLLEDGQKLLLWDIALGCLALSVKYHRDVLPPLSPVFAYEFQGLSPAKLTQRDLEFSQRSVFAAMSYTLGLTPQNYLDELWDALPALRELLNYSRGWDCVQRETWCLLYEALIEPDVLRYPISLLTAAALIHGLTVALVARYEHEDEWYNGVLCRRSKNYAKHISNQEKARHRKAQEEAEAVIQDIQAALHITNSQLGECRRWLASLRAD
ncbi:hypothetical protein BDN72DRAFT_882234 [Pluteus cervinus]|uniref:Uncharacterized protein n=1 Tax=Pluteus cervinus TaxID=181527 RepID=A0ACD3ACN9_9AGAR|nr:hypothetical protein BDN72DRAFT_882234 [Pluteus cervinus]